MLLLNCCVSTTSAVFTFMLWQVSLTITCPQHTRLENRNQASNFWSQALSGILIKLMTRWSMFTKQPSLQQNKYIIHFTNYLHCCICLANLCNTKKAQSRISLKVNLTFKWPASKAHQLGVSTHWFKLQTTKPINLIFQ